MPETLTGLIMRDGGQAGKMARAKMVSWAIWPGPEWVPQRRSGPTPTRKDAMPTIALYGLRRASTRSFSISHAYAASALTPPWNRTRGPELSGGCFFNA
jgi:hypothetical protein